MAEAYPLHWPAGWKRAANLRRSPFLTGFGKARNYLMSEVARMGGKGVVLSTNVPLNRTDGMPRGNYTPDDPAVAIYFKLKGKDMVFACDQYLTVTDNMHAIGKTIEAMRGIERWGASDMMERAFRGFAALPERCEQPWREILGFGSDQLVNADAVESAFRRLAKETHPDNGGDGERFKVVASARTSALRDLQEAAR